MTEERRLNALKILQEVQMAFRSTKDQRNDFGGFNYRNIEAMLADLKPILAEKGCVVTFSDEVVERGGWHYVRAEATLHTTEGDISCTASAREQETKKGMDAAQITGSCSTYARKYALCGLLAVDDGSKDPDARKNVDMITKGQVKNILALAEAVGSDVSEICDYFKVNTLEEMTAEEYGKCLGILNKKR